MDIRTFFVSAEQPAQDDLDVEVGNDHNSESISPTLSFFYARLCLQLVGLPLLNNPWLLVIIPPVINFSISKSHVLKRLWNKKYCIISCNWSLTLWYNSYITDLKLWYNFVICTVRLGVDCDTLIIMWLQMSDYNYDFTDTHDYDYHWHFDYCYSIEPVIYIVMITMHKH